MEQVGVGGVKTYTDWKKFAIESTLYQCEGNVIKACTVLKVAPKTIYNVIGSERVRQIREESCLENLQRK